MVENILAAFEGIWSHKLRSFLTMLGVIIGIAAIITIVSTITGTNQQIKENLVGSGTNAVDVKLMQGDNSLDLTYMEVPDGIKVANETLRKEILELDGVSDVSYYTERTWPDGVYYLKNSFSGNLKGTDTHYFNVNSYELRSGRLFSESDMTGRKKVAVVDSTVAGTLFEGAQAVGSVVEINGEPFTVVGVVTKTNTKGPVIESVEDYYTYQGSSSGNIFIPLDSWSIVYQYDEPVCVAVKADSTDEMTSVGNKASELLNSELVSNDDIKYQAVDLLEQAGTLQNLTKTANTQLIWIACISLIVGGIGVMNIMLVSVTERTREIGLKIAIGAQQSKIRMQFLTEAVVLTSIGGLIGVAAGIGLAFALSKVMSIPVAISVPACIIAFIFSMIIGVVFGLMPAFKASKLNPIDALRHE